MQDPYEEEEDHGPVLFSSSWEHKRKPVQRHNLIATLAILTVPVFLCYALILIGALIWLR